MLPNELPTAPTIPSAHRLGREVERAIDYARMVSASSPDSTLATDLRIYLRAAALLLPSSAKPVQKDKP